MTSLEDLLAISNDYRNAVPEILTFTSSESVEEELLKREEFKVLLREEANKLEDQIAELEAKKRVLSIARGYQTTDTKKLEACKWDLIRSRPKQ